ncbi:MAG TPA: alpha/beta fold hydrolase [Acidimicrobiia bacterium]|jgi:pimeloyl-ACP methyl ester carboxylesterase
MAAIPTPVPTALTPRLPRGRFVTLPDRGRTFVREVDGPAGAPTVVLLHGWMASGALNWYQAFDTLGAHYHVLAPDHRGHARGLRTRRRFRLADCADDVAALCRELGVDEAIAVGYSMGGPIAQLFWHRHRDLCSGLVLGATAAGFIPGVRERIVFTSMMSAAVGTTRLGELAVHMPLVPPSVRPILARSTGPGTLPNWAAREFRRHDWRMLMEAGHAIGTYHASWISSVDVPTAVLLTSRDTAVNPDLQRRMADEIPTSTVHEIADSHIACARRTFAAPLLAAIDDVNARTN